MTTDQRTAVAYALYHPPADPDAIRPLIEKPRLKAIDLGLLRLGDLVCLNEDAEILAHQYGDRFLCADLQIVPVVPRSVCYFVASLTDSDPLELGLAFYPCEVQIDGQAVPFGLPYWTWTGATRTRDLKTFSLLMHFAAEVGVETAMSFAGMTLVYSKDSAGRVKVEQEWDDVPDDC